VAEGSSCGTYVPFDTSHHTGRIPLGESRHGGWRRQHLGPHGGRPRHRELPRQVRHDPWSKTLPPTQVWARRCAALGWQRAIGDSGAMRSIGTAATATAVAEASAAWAGQYDTLATFAFVAWSAYEWPRRRAPKPTGVAYGGGSHCKWGGAEQRAWTARHAAEAGALRVLGDLRAAYYIAAGFTDRL